MGNENKKLYEGVKALDYEMVADALIRDGADPNWDNGVDGNAIAVLLDSDNYEDIMQNPSELSKANDILKLLLDNGADPTAGFLDPGDDRMEMLAEFAEGARKDGLITLAETLDEYIETEKAKETKKGKVES